MNIYRILDKNCKDIKRLGMMWGDVFDGFIVAAKNDEEAMVLIAKHTQGDFYDEKKNRWPYHNEPFTIEIIGKTLDGMPEGVLFQSYSTC